MSDEDPFGEESLIFKDEDIAGSKNQKKGGAVAKKTDIKAGKQRDAKKNNDWGMDDDARESDAKREVMSAQDRIAAMKARLAGIRASEVEEEPKKPAASSAKPVIPAKPSGGAVSSGGGGAGKSQRTATIGGNRQQLPRFSEAPGMGDEDELYDDYDLPEPIVHQPAKKTQQPKQQQQPTPAARPPAPQHNPRDAVDDDEFGDDDVPEIDTRIRSTMALEKHWSEVEEKRKREEALRKRKLKEKQAERLNEEQRVIAELQEKKRREEELRKRLIEEETRRAADDWKQKEEEKRKKFDAKVKAKDLQIQRLEEAKKKREDQKKKLTEEEERRRREYDAEMARLTAEENDLAKKIREEEESKKQCIAEEERRRVEESDKRAKEEEERKRKEAEEEMRLLEEEEKELLRREQEIERELEEKRRLRENKLKEIQVVLQANEAKKQEQERAALRQDRAAAATDSRAHDTELMFHFCVNLKPTARRIKGTMYSGVFSGSQGVDVLFNEVRAGNSRREVTQVGQSWLEAGLFWPIEGAMTFDDSERLYNLDDGNEVVERARKELEMRENLSLADSQDIPPPAKKMPPPPVSAMKATPPTLSGNECVAVLRVSDDAGQQLPKYEFELFLGETLVGRRSDNSISLPVLSVSKKHAKFDILPNGTFYVTDLGSSNKTRLFSTPGGSPVILRPNEQYQLTSGCELLFGEIRCIFEATGQDGPVEYEYEYVYDDVEEDDGAKPAPKGAQKNDPLPLDRFSVAPPTDAAPLPPGAIQPPVALPPRSVVGFKGAAKGPKRAGVKR